VWRKAELKRRFHIGRMAKPQRPLFMSKHVPYVPDWVRVETAQFVPTRSDDRPDAARVAKFVRSTRRDPELRTEVLGVLRRQSLQGPDISIAMLGMLLGAIAAVAAAIAAMSPVGAWVSWLFGIGAVIVVPLFFNFAGAVHFRRIACAVWLAAYEDALRDAERRVPRR